MNSWVDCVARLLSTQSKQLTFVTTQPTDECSSPLTAMKKKRIRKWSEEYSTINRTFSLPTIFTTLRRVWSGLRIADHIGLVGSTYEN